MKKIVHTMLFLSCCIITQQVIAQSKKERAVAIAVQQLTKSMIEADSLALVNSTHDQLSYGHSSGVVDNKQQFIQKIVSGASDFISIEISAQTISITGDAAVVRHVFTAKTNDNGKPGEVKLNLLLIWKKQQGTWKLLARQAVKIAS